MKKIIVIIFLSYAHCLITMEKTPSIPVIESNAQEYSKGSGQRESSALSLLQKHTIDLKNKKVLDAGCATGNISAKMAQKAKRVHGVDIHHNMIEFAKNNYSYNNLSFEQRSIEELCSISSYDYDLVTCFHVFHDVKSHPKALVNMYLTLKENGEFFGNVITETDKKPLVLKALSNPSSDLLELFPEMTKEDFLKSVGFSYPSADQYKLMIQAAGFKIITFQQEKLVHSYKDKEEFIATTRPVLVSRPIIQKISDDKRELFITKIIDLMFAECEKNKDGEHVDVFETTVIHALRPNRQ